MKVTIEHENIILTIELTGDPGCWPTHTAITEIYQDALRAFGFRLDESPESDVD